MITSPLQNRLCKNPSLLLLLLLPLLSTFFLSDLDNLSNYQGDENIWIPVGNDSFRTFFIEHDLSSSFWHDDKFLYGSYNPPVGKYVIGFGTYMAGFRNIPYITFNWKHTATWNIEHGHTLDPEIIRAARLPVALLGCLSCVLVYWLVVLVTDHWHAYVTVCSLVGSRLLVNTSRLAMTDTPTFCFGILALVCMWYQLRAMRAALCRKALYWSIGVGVASGLAVGSKLNALLIPLICIVTLLLEWVVCLRQLHNRLLAPVCGFLIIIIGLVTFIVINPFLYTDLIHGIQHILHHGQIVASASTPNKTTTLTEKWQALQMYTLYYAPLHQIGLPGDRYLLIAGLIGLFVTACRAPTFFWNRSLNLIAIWILITYIGIWLWLPNAWQRYTLPFQPCSAFLQAYGLIGLIRLYKTIAASNRWTHLYRRLTHTTSSQ